MGISPYLSRVRRAIGHELLLLPSVAVLAWDGDGRLLLVREASTGLWQTIGGAVEPDESPHEAAMREAREEAGVTISIERIRGVTGGPQFRLRYPNDDLVGYVTTVFDARLVDGVPQPDGDETIDVGWFSPWELGTVDLTEFTRALFDAVQVVLLSKSDGLVDMVEMVRRLPYGRPRNRTVEGMIRERRGTCSTKHLFLAKALAERLPETDPLIVHRVYTLDRARARELFGAAVAETVPADGLVDVHRYITVALEGRRIEIDATFPGPAWDGRSPLPLACGPGQDYPAGEEPDAEKRALEEQHCDPTVREPFIAAISSPEG
jgi:8-oxo-dGTP pyrophosphatase MutT (NUDIX family)